MQRILDTLGHARCTRALLIVAAALTAGAIVLPLWGMTLVSVQYPEGLRLVVWPTRITGDVTEINMLNRFIGMAAITEESFVELRVIAGLFAASAALTLAAAFVRRLWARVVPLALLVGTAVYGLWSMRRRLYEYGHDLDPTAAMDIDPFTPAMVGENVIAQFGTYAYFSWGSVLPALAALLLALVVGLELRRRRRRAAHPPGPAR